MRIGIDVDQTIVNSHIAWNYYILNVTDYKFNIFTADLSLYEDFWKDDKLYDEFTPVAYAVKSITKLSQDNEIIFISKCFDEHLESKKRFLKESFKFDYEFISIENKWEIPVDVMIDDNEYILDKMDCIKLKIALFNVTSEKYLITEWVAVEHAINLLKLRQGE